MSPYHLPYDMHCVGWLLNHSNKWIKQHCYLVVNQWMPINLNLPHTLRANVAQRQIWWQNTFLFSLPAHHVSSAACLILTNIGAKEIIEHDWHSFECQISPTREDTEILIPMLTLTTSAAPWNDFWCHEDPVWFALEGFPQKIETFPAAQKKQSEIVVNSMLWKPNPNRIRAENNKVKIEQKVSFRSTRLETKPSERSILRSLNVEMLLEKMDTNCSVRYVPSILKIW